MIQKNVIPLIVVISTFSQPIYALEFSSGDLDYTIDSEIRLHNINKTTDNLSGSEDRENDTYIDKIEITANALYQNKWFFKWVVEANELGTENEESLFVNELYAGYKFDELDVYAGRFELPFGFYKKSFISDHITKGLGKTKTEAGLSIIDKYNNVKLSTTFFTKNFRTSDPDQNGASVNIQWLPGDNTLVGGGYLSSRRATKGQPQLINLYARVKKYNWKITGEYVSAIEYTDGKKPSALTLEMGYTLYSQFFLGGRLQKTHDFSLIDGGNGNYTEYTLAANYDINRYYRFSIEHIQGNEETYGTGHLDTKQTIAQLRILF